ncbi:MAG: beta-ketoacyl-ACP synthase II [Kiritimatiellia bacterium]|jgi:3-oxoacyl-[acyl-carrier-protein] synthase II
MERVVITGLGVVSPLGCSLDTFWGRLVAGESGIGRITRFDISGYSVDIAAEVRDFDADAFIDPKEQRRMDPFCRFAVAGAKLAVADSGIDFDACDRDRCGVSISSGVGGLGTTYEGSVLIHEKGPRRISPFTVPMVIPNIAAGMVAIDFHLTGPNYCVVTACASAVHAIGLAARSIRHGDADVMVAGGAEAPVNPVSIASFAAMRALAACPAEDDPRQASRPFDANRCGFVAAEGAGIVVLESASHAAKRGARVYAEVAGFGMTCDAHHITAPREDGEGARRAMVLAMDEAGLNPSDIDYINAHGTSTVMNDRSETLAIKRALGETDARRVAISSTKSMTGHLLGAAGGLETVVCALAIRHGVVPPTINYTTPDPDCDLDYVPNTARELPVKACLNNSFGFGGHNGCLALRAL